jgi:succinyl-diaminopimelate desuccinylase
MVAMLTPAGSGPVTSASLSEVVDDPVELTRRLVDIPSVSGDEQRIADAVEALLRPCGHLEVTRFGHTIVARTRLGRPDRVVLAGHLDTVPEHDNLPSRLEGDVLHGLGTCDMKGGVAVGLHLATTVADPPRDVTYLFYECEEVEAERNGLTILAAQHPDLLEADFAVLMEPSDAVVEAGCQGTMRVDVTLRGQRAHSARSWMGSNAIHAAVPLLATLAAFEPRRPVIDGLEYHEGLNAVHVSGGVAGNVVPDECVVAVNYRFAPDRSEEEALAFLRELFAPYDVVVRDSSPGALPGLGVPAARDFVAAVGGEVNPKFGWTDVARFSGLGVPAVNFGPGDPMYAHRQDEHVPVAHITKVADQLRTWLTGADGREGGRR